MTPDGVDVVAWAKSQALVAAVEWAHDEFGPLSEIDQASLVGRLNHALRNGPEGGVEAELCGECGAAKWIGQPCPEVHGKAALPGLAGWAFGSEA